MMNPQTHIAALDACILKLTDEIISIESGVEDANLDVLASYSVPSEFAAICQNIEFPPLPQLLQLPNKANSSSNVKNESAGNERVEKSSASVAANLTAESIVAPTADETSTKPRMPKRARETLEKSDDAADQKTEAPPAKMRKGESEPDQPAQRSKKNKIQGKVEDQEEEEEISGRRGMRNVDKPTAEKEVPKSAKKSKEKEFGAKEDDESEQRVRGRKKEPEPEPEPRTYRRQSSEKPLVEEPVVEKRRGRPPKDKSKEIDAADAKDEKEPRRGTRRG